MPFGPSAAAAVALLSAPVVCPGFGSSPALGVAEVTLKAFSDLPAFALFFFLPLLDSVCVGGLVETADMLDGACLVGLSGRKYADCGTDSMRSLESFIANKVESPIMLQGSCKNMGGLCK